MSSSPARTPSTPLALAPQLARRVASQLARRANVPTLGELRAAVRDGAASARSGLGIVLRSGAWLDSRDFTRPGVATVMLRHGVGVGSAHAIHAAAHPDRIAVIDGPLRLSYEQLDERINQTCHALLERCGERRTPVLICMENRWEYLTIWFALFRLGWPVVHASTSSTPDDLRYLMTHSGAQLAFASEQTADVVHEVFGDQRAIVATAHRGARPNSFEGFLWGRASSFPGRRGEQSNNIVYTSGTTGRPKGTVRDFARMGPGEAIGILERLPVARVERHLIVSPLYHSAGQVFALLMTTLGATIHLLPDFEPDAVLETLSRHRITSVFLVPTMIARLLSLPAERFLAAPTPSLHLLISGAAPFPQILRERAIRRFGADVVYDFYGASELGWVTLIGGREMLDRPGSLGRPLRGQELRAVRPDGSVCLPGEVGVIQVRTHSRMDGYLNDDDATDEVFDSGWISVEDTGYVDDDGYLTLVGRTRDMIIRGGVNIYPIEIEQVLARHPGVTDVAVFGVPDDVWGEQVAAAIVPAAADLDIATLDAYARQHLAREKVPRAWHLVDQLPRNPTGKVLKRELRDRFA